MSAKHLLWLGSGIIFISLVLQFIGTIWSQPLALVGIAVSAITIPLTLLQASKSAIEEQQKFDQERQTREAQDEYVYSRTPEGRMMANLEYLRRETHMENNPDNKTN